MARRSEPKPMIDNPNAAATKNSDLLKPQPLKVNFDIGHDEGRKWPWLLQILTMIK